MRIISKNNDYYDSVQAYGQDQTLVYKRVKEDLTFDTITKACGLGAIQNDQYGASIAAPFMRYLGHDIPDPFSRGSSWRFGLWHQRGLVHVKKLMVGFCGQWFPCLKVAERGGAESMRDTPPHFKTQFYYASNINSLNEISPWLHKERVDYHLKWMKDFLSLSLLDKTEPFHALQTPIIVVDVDDWGRRRFRSDEVVAKKDAVLADIQFYRHVDAFSAFQTVEQFLSGVLGVGQPETVEISDRDRRDGKGFDDWSFKRRPQKGG